MQIRSLLIVGLVISAIVFVGIGVAMFAALRNVDHALASDRAAREIARRAFDLTLLTGDYLLYHEKRAQIQWEQVHESLGRLLDRQGLGEGRVKLVYSELANSHLKIGQAFATLIDFYEGRRDHETTEVVPAIERRLASQIRLESQVMASEAFGLAAQIERQVAHSVGRANILVIGIVVVVVALMVVTWISFARRVVTPLQALERGVKALRQGNLDYRIGNLGGNEIGQVGREIDEMASNLADEIERRRRIEADLVKTRRQFELILESAGEGIYGLDAKGRTTFANAAAGRMTGWPAEEMLDKPQHDLIHHTRPDGTPYPKEECPIYAAFKDGETHHVDDEVFWRRDGTSFPVEYVSSPLRDHDGVLSGAVVLFRDVTQRKQAEESLKRRTAELAAANQELEAFAYSVSHDLRAPLRSMDGFAQALFEDFGDKLEGDARDYLKRIQAASERMSKLIDGILKISRITRAKLQYETVDLSRMAHEVAEDLRNSEPSRNVAVEIAPGLQAVGDSDLVRVVIENLVGNAWKFTRDTDDARIEVGVAETDEGRAFCVRDNGCGFDPRYGGKLFRPFQRLHTESEFEGSGIGLASVARIVNRHGGTAWAESKPGEGTSVYFTLGDRARKSAREDSL